jgi:hypothetical protein
MCNIFNAWIVNNIKIFIFELFLGEREHTTSSIILILKTKYVPDICI